MAPGTKPDRTRAMSQTFPNHELFEEEMGSTGSVGDPWLSLTLPGASESLQEVQGFEDSFLEDTSGFAFEATSGGNSVPPYQPNTEYLKFLESKLKRIDGKRKNTEKVSSREILKSLQETKEKHLDWSFRQGISSSDVDTLDSDSSGVGSFLTNDLRRKIFPEQHALNETELLHLLDHDIIGKIFNEEILHDYLKQ